MKAVWYRGNPRLWYRDDLVNHPELIPLEGQNVKLPKNSTLNRIYPGVKLLTEPIKKLGSTGFENEDLILNASSAVGIYPISTVFNEELTIDNFYHITDQWWANTSDLNSSQTIEIEFINTSYNPTEYWIIPANGTSDAPMSVRPTPNTWKLEGSNDKVTWIKLHEVKDFTKWNVCQIETFRRKRPVNKAYKYLKFTISKWNAGDYPSMEVGLRRFWIFGKENSDWVAPNIPSPDPAFVYVVPYKDIVIEKTSTKNVLDNLEYIKENQIKLVETLKSQQKEFMQSMNEQITSVRRKNLADEAKTSVKEALKDQLTSMFNTEK